eukprot:gb/GEZN01004876.1/.p1 GENE.gb/GEZN01004876.1/~~gb/GEZN01004876.1/.p1  ORF type:complete len:484 (+),score=66.29 gb/GEZN01004876.1/:61-1512(+)
MLGHVLMLLGAALADQKLIRVIVMGRHGNRCVNEQVEALCPTFNELVKPKFDVPFAALSRVGIAENWELGSYLRERYRMENAIVPEGPYEEGTNTLFYSERYPRNVVATQATMQGLYPPGSGMAGLAPLRLNLIPITTSSAHIDQLMNNPRDGPCRPAYKKDLEKYAETHQHKFIRDNRQVIADVAKACGSPMLTEPHPVYKGVTKDLPWAAKAVADAFTFAGNEGLDTTLGGRLDPATMASFKEMAKEMVNGSRFGENRQLTYWAGDWPATMLKLIAEKPETNKLALYMGHRELIYATAHILGIPIELPNAPPDALPPGCALIIEVFDDGSNSAAGRSLNFTWWVPTAPSGPDKQRAMVSDALLSLYHTGKAFLVAPRGCPSDKPCSVGHVHGVFTKWFAATGNWQNVCGVSRQSCALAEDDELDLFSSTSTSFFSFWRLGFFILLALSVGALVLLPQSPVRRKCIRAERKMWFTRDGYETL